VLSRSLPVSPRFALAVVSVALVAACSTPRQQDTALLPPSAADLPIAGAAVGASNVQFGEPSTAPAPVVDPLALEEATDPDALIVPGQTNTDRPAPPDGDPRNAIERRRDRQVWDKCVLSVQRRLNDDAGGANPVEASPEDYCRERLGMSGRDSVPESRR
jgi:hypothetical protein